MAGNRPAMGAQAGRLHMAKRRHCEPQAKQSRKYKNQAASTAPTHCQVT